MREIPETRYAKSSDGVHIAYQVAGEGPDVVVVMGWVSNIEYMWEWPMQAAFWGKLASFCRLIMFDKRGTGLSDHVPEDALPDLETRMGDVLAVLDAADSQRAAIFGLSEGAAMSALFAATYPDRTSALVMYGGYAREAKDDDHPWGWRTAAEKQEELDLIERSWGTVGYAAWTLRTWGAKTLADDHAFQEAWATYMRRSASPGAALALERMNFEIDVWDILPAIRIPTLLISREGDMPEFSRAMLARIPGARFVELGGLDHLPWVGDQDAIVDELGRFLGVERPPWELDRVLATVLFTDIVGSTATAAALGDRAWHELLEQHHTVVRSMLARYLGTEVDTAGDGFFATFDGPARAVRCAQEITAAVQALGIDVRAGVHTGEVETIDEKAGGMGVVIGARIGALAGEGEVLISRTVKDLVAGSGLVFEDAGEHELKGVPDRWHLYRVMA